MPRTQNNKKLPFMIGSDPEYLLFYGNRSLDTKPILKNFFDNDPKFVLEPREEKGFMFSSEEVPSGDFGWDGQPSTGELRPRATKSVEQHVEFIGKMLEAINNKLPFVDITTLSIGSPIGGHVHLDNPFFPEEEITSTNKRKNNQANKILTTFLVPIIAADHRISAMARLAGSYGKLSDIRNEYKGNTVTSEIRGLTAEWLTTPELAKATITYLAVVWHEICKDNVRKRLYQSDTILRSSSHQDSVHRLLLSDYNIITKALVREIKKEVKTFELYEKYKEECDLILNPNKVYKIKEKAGWNINKGWKLNKEIPKPTKKSLLDTRMIQNMVSKEEFPNIEEHFAVPYNNDYNVATFAKAISERVAVLNWSLKNRYILFGFRKKVKGMSIRTDQNEYFMMSENETKDKISSICQKMRGRFNNLDIRINPKTGKNTDINQNTIIIGLPYDMRAQNDTKTLIKTIWDIENNNLEAKPFDDWPERELEEVGKESPTEELLDCVKYYSHNPDESDHSQTMRQVVRETVSHNLD